MSLPSFCSRLLYCLTIMDWLLLNSACRHEAQMRTGQTKWLILLLRGWRQSRVMGNEGPQCQHITQWLSLPTPGWRPREWNQPPCVLDTAQPYRQLTLLCHWSLSKTSYSMKGTMKLPIPVHQLSSRYYLTMQTELALELEDFSRVSQSQPWEPGHSVSKVD